LEAGTPAKMLAAAHLAPAASSAPLASDAVTPDDVVLALSLLAPTRDTHHLRAVQSSLAHDAWRRRHVAADGLAAMLRSLCLDDPHEITRLPPGTLARMVDDHCFGAASPRASSPGARRRDPFAPRRGSVPRWRLRARRTVHALV